MYKIYKSLFYITLLFLFLLSTLVLTVLNEYALIDKLEYDELLNYKKNYIILNASISENKNTDDLSFFEVTSRKVNKQFLNYPEIIFYKSVISEDKRTADYYAVYTNIDENYKNNKNVIETEVGKLSLCIKKEWEFWGYPLMDVNVFISGKNSDFIYFISNNGETNYTAFDKQKVRE